MKKIIALVTCILMLAAITLPASAAGSSEVVYSNVTTLEDGTVITDEIIVGPQTRSNGITATRKQTISRDGTVIGDIAFQATFIYNGSTVSVSSKSVTRTDTYEGWSYKQSSFTSSGGTVTLEGKLTKLVVLSTKFSMSLTCDKNGNLST